MKSYLLLFVLLGFAALTGCSADDLAGPEAVADDPLSAAQMSHDEFDHTRQAASLVGAWRASDRLGSVTLFIDEPNLQPSSSEARTFIGKGFIRGSIKAPFAVLIEGKHEGNAVVFVLEDTRGEPIAKAKGEISVDFLRIKVVLIDQFDQERELVFDRL